MIDACIVLARGFTERSQAPPEERRAERSLGERARGAALAASSGRSSWARCNWSPRLQKAGKMGGAKQILWIRPLLLSFRRPCFLSECHIARYLRDRQPRLELLLLSTCGELEWARESQVSLSELQRVVGEQSLWHVVFSGPQEDTLPVPGRLPSSIVCAAARTAMKSALER